MNRMLILAAVLGLSVGLLPSSAQSACVGPGCTCTALDVPQWTPMPSDGAEANPDPVVDTPGWYEPPANCMTPEEYVTGCAENIDSCIPAATPLSTDTPPSGLSSWADLNNFPAPAGYRTSNGCYETGKGPCNANLSSATSPNAPSGVANYLYRAAFPCEMALNDALVAGSNVGAIKKFRMRPYESISFSFTAPPACVFTATSSSDNLPTYRTITFDDWANQLIGSTQKFVTISRQSGDFNAIKAVANDPCYVSGTAGELKYAVVDTSQTSMGSFVLPGDACALEAGQTYYLNIRFQDPKDTLMTQVRSVQDNSEAIETARLAVEAAKQKVYDVLLTMSGSSSSSPVQPVVDAQDAYSAAVADTAALNAAKEAYTKALAAQSDPPTNEERDAVAAAAAAVETAQSDYDAAVQDAKDSLNATLDSYCRDSGCTSSDPALVAAKQALDNAQQAYNDVMAAGSQSITSDAFAQDTCEWTLCSNDKAPTNINTQMQSTYAEAFKKEWQCAHDMIAYYTVSGVKEFCEMVRSGYGPPGCMQGEGSACETYTPVNPRTCIGNRTATPVYETSPATGEVTLVRYDYAYTGGIPITDCGISIDMGCGLSAP